MNEYFTSSSCIGDETDGNDPSGFVSATVQLPHAVGENQALVGHFQSHVEEVEQSQHHNNGPRGSVYILSFRDALWLDKKYWSPCGTFFENIP